MLAAFGAPGVLDREFPLPEITAAPAFPARQAISFHFVDYVVHSWDVAKTLGLDARFEPELLEAALRVARAVPGGEARLKPGAAFGPAVSGQGRQAWTRSSRSSGALPAGRRPAPPGRPRDRWPRGGAATV